MPGQTNETDTESTPSSNTDESSTDSATEQEVGVSYALIHEAQSFTNFENLNDPDSIEAQVARGRGQSHVESRVNKGENGDSSDSSAEFDGYEMTVEEGRLKTDSGYVIRFVEEEHLHLGPFDVKGIDTLKDYPAPAKLIDNLTPRIRGHLKEHGFVKVRGAYDTSSKRFYGVQMGWDVDGEVDPWDRLMEVIDQVSTTPAAVDYVFAKEGPERWDIEEIAKVRGIEPGSVRGNVRAIENELDE